MREKRPKRRPVRSVVEVPAPLIQVMPGGRARLDPSAVPDLCAYVWAVSRQWERASRMTYRGLVGKDRAKAIGRVHWAKQMLTATEVFVNAMFQSVALDAVESARSEWTRCLEDTHPEEPQWPSHPLTGEPLSALPERSSEDTRPPTPDSGPR